MTTIINQGGSMDMQKRGKTKCNSLDIIFPKHKGKKSATFNISETTHWYLHAGT